MSIANELNRLLQAKSDLATSIENKGVTVPASATIDGYAALVDQIQQGGGTFPYDAKVECLHSDGKAYIDTGINCQNIGKIECVLRYPQAPGVNHGDGAIGTSFYALTGCCNKAGSSTTFYWGTQFGSSGTEKTSTPTINADTFFHTITLDINNGTVKFDNESTISISVASSPPSLNWWLFMRNGATHRQYPSERRSVKIWNRSGELVRDYISVRYNSVGYMYDKVSGNLYGNNGSGNFTFGADVE